MGIKREELLLGRLVDILNFQQKKYEKQLADSEKKEEIERLLSKYPEEPIKGLIELSNDEIVTLLSYFEDTDVKPEDISIKKYWLEEAIYNENLRESVRYQDAIRLFELLGDNLEEYYEELTYINKTSVEIKRLKTLNKNLLKTLKTGKPVGDLIEYLPILESNKFLTDDKICDILAAISVYNLNIIKNNKTGYIDTVDAIEKQTTSFIIDLLSKEIESIKDKDIPIITSNKIETIDNILKALLEDASNVMDFYPIELSEVLADAWTEDLIEEELEKLSIPITVLKGKQQGLNIDFNNEDQKILDSFVKKVTKELADIKNKEEEKELFLSNKYNRDINKLKLLLNKFNKKEKIYFEDIDFRLIIDLLNEKKVYKETIKNIIITMNYMNISLSNSNFKHVDKEVPLKEEVNEIKEEKKETKVKEKVEEPKKKNENLIEKYGYTFNSFPKKIVNLLNKELQDKEDLLELIENTEELKFVKEYTGIDTKKKINKKIYDVKAGQVYYMLMYSNVDIIKSLLECSKKYNFDIKDIFSIPKVYGSLEIDGTYENFINNVKYLNKNYPELLKEVIKKTPYTLGVDSQLLIRNIELSKLYQLSIETNKIDTKPSFRALGVKEYGYVLDRYIEINDYDYIERFRYQLDTNYSVALRVKYLQAKGLDTTQDDYVNINKKFSKEIVEQGNSDAIGYIELSKGSNDIKWLESINEEKDKTMKNIQYVIKGITISKPKVLITFGNLIKDNSDNINEKLLYSLVKDSYLTKEEFNTLKDVVNNREEK